MSILSEFFRGETADDVWKAAIARLGEDSVPVVQGRGGPTREMLHTVFSIRNPRRRWVFSRSPAINPAFAIVEVIWILRGRNDSRFLTAWNRALPRFAGLGTVFHGSYGYRLRRHFELDQIARAYHVLKASPTSRQLVLQLWDPGADLPKRDGRPRDPDIPCNICAMLKLRVGRLEWCQIIRSNDMMLGFPYNVVQWTCLQEIMAGWLGVDVGEYVQLSDSAHIYARDFERGPLASAEAETWDCDDLRLPFRESVAVFKQLEKRVCNLTRDDLTSVSLERSLRSLGHRAYDNLLCVIGAEAARRQGWIGMATELIKRCENDGLAALWNRWKERVHGAHRGRRCDQPGF
jgi:thymidylate synthase